MGKFKPGQSGNLTGRPPRSKALSEILTKALSAMVDTPNGRIAGKRLIAKLVTEGVTTGKVTFPGDEKPSLIGMKDWIEFVKWAYQYLDPPVQRSELTGADGGPVILTWRKFIEDTNE